MSNTTILYMAQMGRFFSHYALRTLLVLYLVKDLLVSDFEALSISAFICSLVQLGGVLGGVIADHYLGIRCATKWGSLVLAIGYISLTVPSLFFAGIALVIVGSSLFVGNISALLGLNYTGKESSSHAGFTHMYALQNLSALAGTLVCATIAGLWGFQMGFAVASIGMGISCVLLYRASPNLLEKPAINPSIVKPLLLLLGLYGLGWMGCNLATLVLPSLPFITVSVLIGTCIYLVQSGLFMKRELSSLLIRLLALTLFFVIEDQTCSSLMLLAERGTDRTLFSWTVPSAWITGMNPIIIVLFGSLGAKRTISLWAPFTLTAITFAVLAMLCLTLPLLPLWSLVVGVAAIAGAELLIGPATYSQAFKSAPKQAQGLVMSMVGISFALAFQLSGLLGRFFFSGKGEEVASYSTGFVWISLGLLIGGGTLHLLLQKAEKPTKVVKN